MALSTSIMGTVASNLLFMLMKENFYVGLAGGIQGLMQMIVAFPAGWYADKNKYSRSILLKKFIIFPLLACICTFIALLVYPSFDQVDRARYFIFLVAYIFWGISDGCTETIIEAIFSDSLTNGQERTSAETTRALIINIGSASGPLTSILLFNSLGDQWSTNNLVIVWLVGISIASISSFCLCFYSDDTNINFGANEQASLLYTSSALTMSTVSTSDEEEDREENSTTNNNDYQSTTTTTTTLSTLPKVSQVSPTFGNYIPHLCIACDILCSLGSGMTVQFWTLFFEKDVKSGPLLLNVTLLVSCLFTAAAVYVGSKVAKKYGRIVVTLVTSSLGIISLFLIGKLVISSDTGGSSPNQSLMATLFILRTGFMNASTPLLRAVLMDNISFAHRAKWASMSSVTTVGWSGSALLGGWLCDQYGYNAVFFITVVLQTVSLIPLLPLIRF
jgi:hypothetical protein